MRINQVTVMLPYLNDIYKIGERPKYNRQFKDFEEVDSTVKSIEEIRNGDLDEYFIIITFENGNETHLNSNVLKIDFVE